MSEMPIFSSTSATTSMGNQNILLKSLVKHWALGLSVLVLTVALAAFYTAGQTRTFRTTATIQIDPNPPRPLGNQVQAVVDMGAGSYWNNKEYFTTQQKILQGRSLAQETVRTLNLHGDPTFMTLNGRSSRRSAKPDLEDATLVLMSRLTVESVRDSRLVNVSLVDVDPMRGRRILAALVDLYLQKNVDSVVSSTGAASEWLRDQVGKLKAELEHSELALHAYKKDKQILSVSLDDQSNMLRGEMQQLNEALTRCNAKREELEARSRELDKVQADQPNQLPATELLANTLLSSLRKDYVQAQSNLNGLLGEGRGELHPTVASARATVETTREALLAEIRNVQGAVRNDLAAVTREAQGLSGLFVRAKQRAMDLNMLEIEFHRLERSKTNTEKLYQLVLERSKESDLTGMLRFNNISVVEPPTLPKAPYSPRVGINLAIGLLAGVLAGIFAALGREFLDQTVRAPQDIQSEDIAPLIGTLPLVSAQSAAPAYYSRRRRKPGREAVSTESQPELAAHDAPGSNVAECARSIRTSLMFASPDRPFRRILVTSASPGEGKTTVACSIAIAFAQAGQRVLLIDCDLRRPRLHRIMQRENTVGLTTALHDPSESAASIRETRVPNLAVLTAGPHVPNPAELVQSESFGRLISALSESYDRLILDSPPVLAVTDALVAAVRVDTTLLVARAGRSRRDMLRQVTRKLAELHIPLAGIILNAIDVRRAGGVYQYYYPYYGYGRKYDSASGEAV